MHNFIQMTASIFSSRRIWMNAMYKLQPCRPTYVKTNGIKIHFVYYVNQFNLFEMAAELAISE